MAVGFLVGVVMTRYLAPYRFGQLSEALALLALVSPLCDLGLTAFLRTELLSGRFPAERLMVTVMSLRVFSGCLAALMLTVLAASAETSVWILILAASLTLFSPVLLSPEQWFTSRLQSKIPAVIQVAVLVFVAALRLGLIKGAAPLWAFALCFSIEPLLAGIILFAAMKKGLSINSAGWDFSLAKIAVKASVPLLLAGVAIGWQARIDQLLLAHYAGSENLGFYAAAVRFSEVIQILISAICLSLLPQFAAGFQKKPEDPTKYLGEMLQVVVSIGLIWALFCTLTARFWIPVILGKSFAQSASLLGIHAWTCVFSAMGFARGTLWTLQGKNRWTLWATITGFLVSVVLNFLLVPKFGAVACAWLSLLSSIICNCLTSLATPGGKTIFRLQIKSLVALFNLSSLRRVISDLRNSCPAA